VGELLPFLVVALVVAAAGWFAARPPAVFVVRVRAGQPEATHGKVTGAFLAAVAEVCREFKVQTGEIRGVAWGRRIRLWFSPGIPRPARQRLRNWWAMSGWSARPGRR
jgi:hypothetical protein